MAKDEEVSVGGWRFGSRGDTRQEARFAERLTRAKAPWALERDEPFQTIAALELLGVLAGVQTLTDEAVPAHESIGGTPIRRFCADSEHLPFAASARALR